MAYYLEDHTIYEPDKTFPYGTVYRFGKKTKYQNFILNNRRIQVFDFGNVEFTPKQQQRVLRDSIGRKTGKLPQFYLDLHRLGVQ
jgi:hypothetical protein